MKIREAQEIFSHLYDKYRDEGITAYEAVRHINTALMTYVKREFKREFERGSTDAFRFNELQVNDIEETTTSQGRVSLVGLLAYSPIDYVFDQDQMLISSERCEILGVIRGQRWDGDSWAPLEFVRMNDFADILRDPFTKPCEEYPKWLLNNNRIEIYPKGERRVRLDIVRMPRHCNIADLPANDIDLEVSNSMAYDIIEESLRFAGVNIRDQELYNYAVNEMKIDE